jgi:hypothetical protein
MKTDKQIFKQLCEIAMQYGSLYKHYKRDKNNPINKPGGLINKQSKEDRELLSQLTSDDTSSLEVIHKDYWCTEETHIK